MSQLLSESDKQAHKEGVVVCVVEGSKKERNDDTIFFFFQKLQKRKPTNKQLQVTNISKTIKTDFAGRRQR